MGTSVLGLMRRGTRLARAMTDHMKEIIPGKAPTSVSHCCCTPHVMRGRKSAHYKQELQPRYGMQIPGRWEPDRHNHNLAVPFHCCSGKLAGRVSIIGDPSHCPMACRG